MTDSSAPYAPLVLARFRSKVEMSTPGGCWRWTDTLDRDGYGRFRASGQQMLAHRFAYVAFRGLLSPTVEVDHTCHTRDESCLGGVTCLHRRCVNPDHLEAVTHQENQLRGRTVGAVNAQKTHCSQGHLLDGTNLRIESGGRRRCRTCHADAVARGRARKRPKANGTA